MRGVILAVIGLFAGVDGANAAGLCNCCGANASDSCTNICQPIEIPQGQCVAVADFAAKSQVTPDANPLYEFSMRDVRLPTRKGSELEDFRRLLEMARREVEKDRRVTLRAHARGKIDETMAAANIARYEAAIVNYYLGIQAYRQAHRSR